MPAASIKKVFLLLGTHEDPFLRLSKLSVLLANKGLRVVIQYGHTPQPPETNSLISFQFCSYYETLKHIKNADLVITHSGTGSIISCLHNGKKPLVIPRHQSLGEHVDDHQLEIAREFAQRDFIHYIEKIDLQEIIEGFLTKEPGVFQMEKPVLESKMDEELKVFFKTGS